jgi:hypothetical protein
MSRMSRFLSWLGVGLFLAGNSIVLGESTNVGGYTCDSPEVQARVKDLGADCNPGGLTAISKLPGARVIVFDPMSRSFLFTTCSNPTPNEEVLDRRRLALSTQKLRLLVLPYNPADGDLQIETTPGTGTEFDSISSAGTTSPASPAALPPATPPAARESGAKATSQPPPTSGAVVARGQALESKLKQFQPEATGKNKKQPKPIVDQQDFLRFQQIQATEPRTLTNLAAQLRESGKPTDPSDLLGVITKLLESSDIQTGKARKALSEFSDGTECVDRHVDDMPRNLGAALTKVSDWTPARDQRLCAVVAEAINRQKVIEFDSFQPCNGLGDQGTEQGSFESNVQSLKTKKNDVDDQLGTLDSLLAEISHNLGVMKALPVDPKLTTEWKAQADAFSQQLDADQKYLSTLNTQLAATVKTFDGARQKRGQFKVSQGSQAAQLHRENYPPLANGSSVTFKVSRITDGSKSSQPIAQLEVRSAPVYNLRFGTGLVVSQLKDPTFKLGPVAATASNGTSSTGRADTSPTQKILFDDEGGRRVLPMIMVHHYWGRRSPLLSPTLFEKLMPTFSLGIPVAKADPLTQVLFGLDWELTPGVELNAGVHYGQVNSLTGGFKVGDDPMGADITSIQKKTFSSALYFGIVVNGDTFKTLMDSQK